MKRLEESQFSVDELVSSDQSISVCIPAHNEEATIGEIVERLIPLKQQGALAELVVIDDRSTDSTAKVAERAGAKVFASNDLMQSFGECLGKGDAMWRAQAVLSSDIVCYIDADIRQFSESFVVGLAGALVSDQQLSLVKGAYQRPLYSEAGEQTQEGGRVNSLLARPLLRSLYPEIAWLSQPLAGETAVRSSLLAALPVVAGYGVEIAMLIDTCRLAGASSIGEVDLGIRYHRNRKLSELAPMADEVLAAALSRLKVDSSSNSQVPCLSRPAMNELVVA